MDEQDLDENWDHHPSNPEYMGRMAEQRFNEEQERENSKRLDERKHDNDKRLDETKMDDDKRLDETKRDDDKRLDETKRDDNKRQDEKRQDEKRQDEKKQDEKKHEEVRDDKKDLREPQIGSGMGGKSNLGDAPSGKGLKATVDALEGKRSPELQKMLDRADGQQMKDTLMHQQDQQMTERAMTALEKSGVKDGQFEFKDDLSGKTVNMTLKDGQLHSENGVPSWRVKDDVRGGVERAEWHNNGEIKNTFNSETGLVNQYVNGQLQERPGQGSLVQDKPGQGNQEPVKPVQENLVQDKPGQGNQEPVKPVQERPEPENQGQDKPSIDPDKAARAEQLKAQLRDRPQEPSHGREREH